MSFWNYADILNIILSLINIYMQLMVGPYEIQCRIIMCLMVINITVKSFFFMRIFPSLTPVVVMLSKVIYDLRIFLFFYGTLLFFFCLLYSVLGLGNDRLRDGDEDKRFLKASATSGGGGGGGSSSTTLINSNQSETEGFLDFFTRDRGIDPNGAAKEYHAVGLLVGEFMWTFRISMGDFSAIDASKKLSPVES